MTDRWTLGKIAGAGFLIAALIVSGAVGADYSVLERDHVDAAWNPPEVMSPRGQNYGGALRVFVVEPEGRWDMNFWGPYHYAFIGFAMNIGLNMVPFDTNTWSVEWRGGAYGYGNISDTNIMVIGAIFNGEGHGAYSDPGENNHPFTAHYVDAGAAAYPGETGRDTAWGTWTHTGVVEKGSAGW